MSSLEETDQESAAVATAPRVTLAQMEGRIVNRLSFTAAEVMPEPLPANHPLTLLTICVLQLDNGFTLVGKSAPASPENFNADLGAKLAYEDAIRQLWPLEGYLLREQLSQVTGPEEPRG